MKKNGFTLVELMGVITVLGLITLLVAPTIINQIRNSKNKIDSVTEKLIYAATDLYLDNKENDYPKRDGAVYCLTLDDLINDGKLSKPVLNSNGNEISLETIIAVDVKNSRYNYRMSSGCENKNVKNLSELTTTLNPCSTDKTAGSCANGTLFTIEINDSETKDFYVIEDTGTTVTLIMSENLGDEVAWYHKRANDKGPIALIAYLKDLTDMEWSNIPENKYVYSGIAQDGITRKYDDITETMKARVISYEELSALKEENKGTMPEYVCGGTHYWTSTARSTGNEHAWYLTKSGKLWYDVTSDDIFSGVRPVITLLK